MLSNILKQLNHTRFNFKYYPNPPKMGDKQIIRLSLFSESLDIDSVNYFLSKLKTDYSDYFPDVHITRYIISKKT